MRRTTARMAQTSAETARVRRLYDRSAGRYDRTIGLAERLLFDGGRRWVCAQARGDVLEVAVGTGRNFPYYPAGTRVTGVELSPAMLALAHRRANDLGREVTLCVGDAQALPFPSACFDTVVITLALCTIPNDRQAILEVARVLRPGGFLVALEHVRSPRWPVRAVQHALEPLAIRLQGDHLLREPLETVRAAGLKAEQCERSKWGIVQRLVARKPA